MFVIAALFIPKYSLPPLPFIVFVCDVIKVQTLFKAFTLTVYELQNILDPVLPFFRDSNII